MLLRSLKVAISEFETGTGWQVKPEGACKADVCIPLPDHDGKQLDVRAVAAAMNLPLVEEPDAGLYALGPESIGGRALLSAAAAELTLPDLEGNPFKLSSLKGQKIIVYAWAPY